MASFKLNPKAGMVFIPGRGRVREGEVLMGEEYRKYTPKLLVEVPDAPTVPPVEVKVVPKKVPMETPKPLAEAPLEAAEPKTSPNQKVLTEETPIPKAKPVSSKKFSRRKPDKG